MHLGNGKCPPVPESLFPEGRSKRSIVHLMQNLKAKYVDASEAKFPVAAVASAPQPTATRRRSMAAAPSSSPKKRKLTNVEEEASEEE